MGHRRKIVRTLGIFVAQVLGAAPAATAGGSTETVPLEIEVHARAIAPGEALRIVARSRVPLAELSGSFLGEPVFFTPAGGGTRGPESRVGRAAGHAPEPGTEWTAWAAVDLDRKTGRALVEARGKCDDGREATGRRAVRIAAKRFPEQRLAVEDKFVTPPPEVQARIEKELQRLAAVYTTRRPAPPPREPFVRPVPGEPTGVFGTRRFFNGTPRSPHPGLDLRSPEGSPVGASGAGLVVLADDLYYSGNTVIIDHGGGLFTLYAHLSKILVKEGDSARGGQIIGLSGATGRVTGPHLHWGAKVGDRPFDPTALLEPRLFR